MREREKNKEGFNGQLCRNRNSGRERERGCKILETSGERLVEKQADHRRETGRSP